MEVFKKFKLFGLYFYVSSVRMKRRRSKDEKMRNQRNVLQKKKRLLYKLQDGCCEQCGKPFVPEALEIHHIVSISENPGMALQTRNLMLLCHDCHVEVHRKTDPRDEI